MGTEHYPVVHPYDAPAPIRFHHLGIEQLRQRPFGLAALGLNLLAVMRHQRHQVLAESIGEKQRGALRCQHLRDLMD